MVKHLVGDDLVAQDPKPGKKTQKCETSVKWKWRVPTSVCFVIETGEKRKLPHTVLLLVINFI